MPGAEEKPIDLKAFTKLCNFQCTQVEIAAFFEVSPRTIERRIATPAKDPETGAVLLDDKGNPEPSEYKVAYERGMAQGRAALRRLQWRHANEKGSHAVQMTIHLSKFWLGETEKSLMPANKSADPTTPRKVIIRGGLTNPAPDTEIGEEHKHPLPNPFAPKPDEPK